MGRAKQEPSAPPPVLAKVDAIGAFLITLCPECNGDGFVASFATGTGNTERRTCTHCLNLRAAFGQVVKP